MEEISIEPICEFNDFKKNCGKFYNTATTLLNPIRDIRVIDKSADTLFILRKNVIPIDILKNTVDAYLPVMKKMTSSNRGFAAGSTTSTSSTYDRSNTVHSIIAGYIDSPNNKFPCRLTQFSNKHFDTYTKGIPLISKVDELFKETLPERYKAQKNLANNTKFSIKDTAFTTLTINYNFQTALHIDKGDCQEGFGVLVVSSKNVDGGYLLFPRFDIGIFVNDGDVLFVNVHEYHCNSSLITHEDGVRMSFVFYLRKRLLSCKQNELLKELDIEEGKHWDTGLLINKINNKIIGISATKQLSFNDPKNWIIEYDRYTFLCKNRQYKLYDKVLKKQVISLQNIWNYIS